MAPKGRYWRAFPVLVAGWFVVLEAAPAQGAANTYPVKVVAYCQAPTNVCGAATEDDFRAAMKHAFFLANWIWHSVDVSLRIESIQVYFDPSYADIHSDCLKDGNDAGLVKLNQLRAQAAADPAYVYLFIVPGLGGGFSGIPGSFYGRAANPKMPDEFYGVFCGGPSGVIIAHEMGHHFCLHHPFTFWDPAEPGSFGHDGDGLAGTPPDPGVVEFAGSTAPQSQQDAADVVFATGGASCPWSPESCAVVLNEGHEWCGLTGANADPGSTFPTYCTPQCRSRTGGQTVATAAAPHTENIMSYYGGCEAPLVYQNKSYPAFTPDQATRVAECVTDSVERGALLAPCQALGGDTDGDGLCNDEDPCPLNHGYFSLVDADQDGIPNACDLCPWSPDPEEADNDKDGAGDACDPDDDNDGCEDGVDQHPLEAKHVVGQILYPGCSPSSVPVRAFEGLDHDQDGVKDCADPDDDGDGIEDADDECPIAAGSICVVPGESCPAMSPWADCMGGGCGIDVLLKLEALTNPGPDDWTLLPFEVRDDILFVSPDPDRTLSEVFGYITGAQWDFKEGGERVGLSIVDATGTLIKEIGSVRAMDLETPGFGPGKVLALEFLGAKPVRGDLLLRAATTWGVGVPPGAALDDGDGDGIPDVADNCTVSPNGGQIDVDADGFGNACDPDLDQDGLVTQGDVDAVSNCKGAEPGLVPGVMEPGSLAGTEVEPGDVIRGILCRSSDLDGDGLVTETDVAAAQSLMGQAPGPSGRFPPPVPPAPDPETGPETVEESGADRMPEPVGDIVTPPDGTAGGETIRADAADSGEPGEPTAVEPPVSAPGGSSGGGACTTGGRLQPSAFPDGGLLLLVLVSAGFFLRRATGRRGHREDG